MSRRPHGVRFAALAVAALGVVTACRRGPGGERFPDAPIALISIDTLRSDHLPAYGYHGVATPAIDALRRDGVLFERAYAHVPLTLPSHCTLFAGELPPATGVRDNFGYTFDAVSHPFLPSLLRRAGWSTGGAVSTWVLRGATGLGTDFEFFGEVPNLPEDRGLGEAQRSGQETLDELLRWLDRAPGKKPFLFLHLYEPHSRYRPPEPFKSRYASVPYDGEIATADAIVGRFLDELRRRGLYERAIVVLLSDHGEGLGDHGEPEHGFFLYREALQVPLLVKLPGQRRAGESVAAPAQLIDVAPTLLRLVGLEPPRTMPGRNLFAAEPPAATASPIYGETFYPRLRFGWSELTSLIDDRFHLVQGPQPELFDLVADPAERIDARDRERRVYARLRDALAATDLHFAGPHAADAETRSKLASLGYLTGSARESSGPRPDPRSKSAVIAAFSNAAAAFVDDQLEVGVQLMEPLTKLEPGMLDAWILLANGQRQLGHTAESIVAFERALELSDGDPEFAMALAASHFTLGHLDQAKAYAELAPDELPCIVLLGRIALARHDAAAAFAAAARAKARGKVEEALLRDVALLLLEQGRGADAVGLLTPLPDKAIPPTVNAAALALGAVGRAPEGIQMLTASLARDPSYAVGQQSLGTLHLQLGHLAEARAALETAVKLNPRLAEAWNSLGVALYQTEGPAAALSAWQRSVALDPRQFDALFNLGLVAADRGQRDLARRSLRQFLGTAPPDRYGPDLQKARGLLAQLGG